MKASGVSLTPAACARVLERSARLLELGDVRFVELGDVRDVDPTRLQARTGDPLDARQRLRLDGSELREIDLRQRRQRPACRCGCPRHTRGTRRERALDECFHVLVRDAPLETAPRDARQVNAQLARELAHRGSGVCARESRLVDRRQITAVGSRLAELRPWHQRAARCGALGHRCRCGRRGCRRGTRRCCSLWRGLRCGLWCGLRCRLWCGLGSRGGLGRRRAGRRSIRARPGHGPGRRSQGRHQVARGNRSALGYVQLLDDTVDGRGHVHGRLVGLERDERGLGRHALPGFYQHVDDGNVLEVAEIGYAHFRKSRAHAARRPFRPSTAPASRDRC